MTDEGHRTIDKAYDAAERVVDGIGRVLGVDTSTAKPIAPSASTSVNVLKDANVKVLPASTTTSGTKALPAPADVPFRIVETITEAGVTIWTVTNGTVTADCKSRAFAEQVMSALVARTTAIAPAATVRGRRHGR